MSLRIKRAEFVNDSAVELTLEEDDGQAVVHRFTLSMIKVGDGEIPLLDGGAYSSTYCRAPGPAFPRWPLALVRQMFDAMREPLPSGEEYELIWEEFRRKHHAEWIRSHPATEERQPG